MYRSREQAMDTDSGILSIPTTRQQTPSEDVQSHLLNSCTECQHLVPRSASCYSMWNVSIWCHKSASCYSRWERKGKVRSRLVQANHSQELTELRFFRTSPQKQVRSRTYGCGSHGKRIQHRRASPSGGSSPHAVRMGHPIFSSGRLLGGHTSEGHVPLEPHTRDRGSGGLPSARMPATGGRQLPVRHMSSSSLITRPLIQS